MYKLVIFDLDGTLLDTLGDLAAAGNHALREMGLPLHPVSAYKYFVGNGIPKLIERILPENHTKEDESRALGMFGEYYGAHKADSTKPYDGMTELVSDLCGNGVICACNSNKDHKFSKALVDTYYGSCVRAVMGAGIGFARKPDPGAALSLCERFGVGVGDALYVGDSSVDVLTAKAAGMDCCAVTWGFRTREELEECSPRYIADSPEQLRRVVLGELC